MRTHIVVRALQRDGRLLFVAAALTFIAFAIFSTSSSHSTFSSAEAKFADSSKSGLSIVPASCPSDPHYAGECTGAPLSSNNLCLLSSSAYSIAAGQSATLSWSTATGEADQNPQDPWRSTLQYGGGSIAPAIGAVGPNGSQRVSPQTTTTYVFSGQLFVGNSGGPMGGAGAGGGALFTYNFRCDATITVGNSCPIGYVMSPQGCVFSACPTGYTYQIGAGGKDECVITSCSAGYTLQNGQCIVINQCTAEYYCQGDDLYHRNADCSSASSQHCAYGCSGSACLSPPPPSFVPFDATKPDGTSFSASGHLQALPVLLQKNSTSQLYWQVKNVSSCTISGTNGQTWSDKFSGVGGKTSSPITSRTIYTLLCQSLPGATPSSVSDQVIINVVPVFNEQ